MVALTEVKSELSSPEFLELIKDTLEASKPSSICSNIDSMAELDSTNEYSIDRTKSLHDLIIKKVMFKDLPIGSCYKIAGKRLFIKCGSRTALQYSPSIDTIKVKVKKSVKVIPQPIFF